MNNFGAINNAFTNALTESFMKKDEASKKAAAGYIKMVKENKILKTQYIIFNHLTSRYEPNASRANEYIKEHLDLISKFTPKDIKKANDDLLSKVQNKGSLKEDYTHKTLHESIAYLIETNNRKTPSNLDKRVDAFSVVLEHIMNNKPEDKEEIVAEEVCNLAVEKFNEKYSSLTKSERELLTTLIDGDTGKRSELIGKLTKECVDMVNVKLEESADDLETKDKLLRVKDKLLRTVYNESSFVSDVTGMVDLRETLK